MPVEAVRFDVFLSHNHADAAVVERIAERLQREGITPWLAQWALTPGDTWQPKISNGLRASRACAVFVGPHGLGGWAREELGVAQDRAAKEDGFRLFMVLLPGAVKPDDPSLAFLANRTWVDLRGGVDDLEGFQDLRSAISGARRSPPRAPQHDDQCPYRGLEVFNEEHAGLFFGRAGDIARVVEKLRDSRFLAVLGPSGCGKSSLVRAGVIPALKRGGLPGSGAWPVRLVVPGAHPLTGLGAQLARLLAHESMQRTVDGLRADERSLDLAVSLALADRPADERLVLVVDQLEEVFTLCADEAERAAFLANLCYAGSIPGGRVVVVVAMRADFYHRCAAYPELRALMAAQQFLVGPLGRDGLREVIERPAWRVGLELEAGLVETILGDVAGQGGSLPLLEYVLWEVWQRRAGRTLTLAAYVAAGGVVGGLAQRANAVYQALSPAEQRVARRVLLRLVQPGEGGEDTRRRAQMDELAIQPEGSDAEVVVKALADARLVTTSRDEATGAVVVDVAHEALIRGWPELRGWIDEDRELLGAHRRLAEAAAEWERSGREEAFLYRGARLAAWRDRSLEDLNDLERAFLAASGERERDELATARRRNRRLRALSAVLVVLLAVAVWQRQEARQQRDLATARQLAAEAVARLDQQPLPLLLSLESLRLAPTDEGYASLRQALLRPGHNAFAIIGHAGPIFGVAFSPDGTTIASTSADRTVRLWEAATGQPIGQPLTGHTGEARRVAFSPDGKQLASASLDRTVRLWDTATGQPIGHPLTDHTDGVWGVAFSPDGRMIASAGLDRTVRLWDTATGQPIGQPLTGHTEGVWGVAFSPDGRTIASASFDRTVRLWDATTGEPIGQPLGGHAGAVLAVAFSPDGKTIASASDDKTVRLWDAAPTALIGQPLAGHTDWALGVAFSPDGRTIASASRDRTVRLWDTTNGQPIGQPLTGHTGWVEGVAFSPDGRTIASASDDHTVRLWNAATGAPIGQPLTGHSKGARAVVFSPDGKIIASASLDQTVQLWDVATGQPIGQPLTGHTEPVYGVAFSPDGETVASASDDRTVRLWDVATGEPIGQPLTGHTDHVSAVAFSPDGAMIVSASIDQTVRVWDAATGEPIGQPLTGHTGGVQETAFSRDGKMIASAGSDWTVRVWDAATGEPIGQPLTGHIGTVFGVAFSPDGRTVASASADQTVRLWPITIDVWIHQACALAKRNLRQEEWNEFIGRDRPYVRACPDLPSGYGAPPDAPAATYHLD